MLATLRELRNQPFFESLTDDEINKAIDCLQLHIVKLDAKKQFDLNAFKSNIGLILSGQLLVEKHNASGERFIVTSLERGDLIWPIKLSLTEEHLITAKKNIALLCFEQAHFSDACALRSYIYQQLFNQALQQQQKLIERVDLLGHRRLRERILAFLEKQGAKIGQNLTIPYSRTELADYLQVDRSSLSRELAAMKEDGLIDYHLNTFRLIE